MGKTKLLFFDIDGTIWDFNNKIPNSAIEAIRAARRNGHKVFLNTGRSRGYVRNKNLLNIGFDGIVSGCGTSIEYNGEIIFIRYIENELMAKTLLTLKFFKFRTILEGFEYLYLDAYEWPDDPYVKKLSRDLEDRLKSMSDHWKQWDKICKFACDTTGSDTWAGLEAISDDFKGIVHNPYVVEVVPHGFSKASGIEYVCNHLGVDVSDTFSFGDSANDMDMITFAGTGVSMGNGSDEIKEVADYVTTSMKKDGIKNALKHFNLI